MLCSEWVFSFVAALFIYNEHVFIYMFFIYESKIYFHSIKLLYYFFPNVYGNAARWRGTIRWKDGI